MSSSERLVVFFMVSPFRKLHLRAIFRAMKIGSSDSPDSPAWRARTLYVWKPQEKDRDFGGIIPGTTKKRGRKTDRGKNSLCLPRAQFEDTCRTYGAQSLVACGLG